MQIVHYYSFSCSSSWTQFPVKLTEPLTSILYITADKIHMEELKHAIHLTKIVEGRPACLTRTLHNSDFSTQHDTALCMVSYVFVSLSAPAHEHSLIAAHKHGHALGGLPTIFWVSIGFLIVIFHVFLFKLVFNEYCNFGNEKYMRSRYNVWDI